MMCLLICVPIHCAQDVFIVRCINDNSVLRIFVEVYIYNVLMSKTYINHTV